MENNANQYFSTFIHVCVGCCFDTKFNKLKFNKWKTRQPDLINDELNRVHVMNADEVVIEIVFPLSAIVALTAGIGGIHPTYP